MDDNSKALKALTWKHISAKEFEQAQEVVRRRIEEADPGAMASGRDWNVDAFGWDSCVFSGGADSHDSAGA